MERLLIDSRNARVSHDNLKELFQTLKPEIIRLHEARTTQYASNYASINLPADVKQLAEIERLINEKKALNPSMLVIIGIGGSNLGTLAIHQAVNGPLFNERGGSPKVYFLETVESDYTHTVFELIKNALTRKEVILVNVVTKSGTTTETVANFLVVLELLKKFHPQDYAQYVIVTSNKNSKLWRVAEQEQFACLAVPELVGGRYSVFSAVGLFPLGLIGIDIRQILSGAHDMVHASTQSDLTHNQAALNACIKYYYYQRNVRINDFFVFNQSLAGVGAWYRQLMGESLGKTTEQHGVVIDVGITPTVSIGTTDLHSVGQLYLGGPRDKFITFVSVETVRNECTVPFMPLYSSLVPHIQGQTLDTLMHAMLGGVLKAYEQEQRPFIAISIPESNAYYIGQLMQMYMIEMMYLGYLLGVDPFDQPHVELYKEQTRKILAHE